MDVLIGGSSNIIASVSADLFDSNINVLHHHKEASDDNIYNDRSNAVTSNSPCAIKSKVAITETKKSLLFNQSADIKVGYFGKFEFVDSQ